MNYYKNGLLMHITDDIWRRMTPERKKKENWTTDGEPTGIDEIEVIQKSNKPIEKKSVKLAEESKYSAFTLQQLIEARDEYELKIGELENGSAIDKLQIPVLEQMLKELIIEIDSRPIEKQITTQETNDLPDDIEQLRKLCAEKGIKYKNTQGVKTLKKLINAGQKQEN